MKISSKIILLTAILLGFLGGNAFISWQEINKVRDEFNEVVKNDLKLMQATTALNDLQLKKEILFEKLTSAAEELAFGNSNDTRRQYLLDYVKDLHDKFQQDSRLARQQLDQALSLPAFVQSLGPMFENVRKILGIYDQKVETIFTAVAAMSYQLSMEDLDQVQTPQAELAKELQQALVEVWTKIDASVLRMNELQQQGQRVLWITLILSFMIALVLASAIIRRIHTALKMLVKGVRDLQQGRLGAQVMVKTSDEIGELSKAFNHMSDELKTYQEDMQRKNVELDRFVHLISHDIYGPIMAIIFYGDYLQKNKEGFDEKTKQAVDKLTQVSARLNTMVTDLLEMTKITRTKRPFERVDIALLIQEALQRQEFLIQKTSAVIHLPETYPTVWADRLKLSVVFYNLIGNAVKYSSKGDNKPQVAISWQKRPGDYMFGIKDNGIGIAKEHFGNIFDIFKRLPEAESFEGSGVGLAIVKDIIQEHGGQIWVESNLGSGTQFFFTIPLESPHALR
jgi:signal transduction histidine kinase